MRMKRIWGYCLSLSIFLLCVFQIASISVAGTLNSYGVESDNPYVVRRFVQDGKEIDEVIVPGRPPEFYRAPEAIVPDFNSAAGIKSLSNVPAFDWSYGCSATSAAMMFGYYDNTGYPNLYAGPTNGGLCPMTNAVWGEGECPLSATHQGKDGRTIKGHVDDYWIAYGSMVPDPFIGNWTEHSQGECTGDFMGTNQSQLSNSDGSTTFWIGRRPLYDYIPSDTSERDGCHGMKLFFESRGYAVVSNYSQYIYGYGHINMGFTFEQYKQEIDAGRPVLIQVEGHTMLGYGYDDSSSLVYLHDTWDYGSHSMIWGGSYEGMRHYGVTVFIPASVTPNPTLIGLSISGQASLNEESTASYTATASWSDDTTTDVTSISTWKDNSYFFASINTTGVLTTKAVNKNKTVTITATYISGGVTKSATKSVTIINKI